MPSGPVRKPEIERPGLNGSRRSRPRRIPPAGCRRDRRMKSGRRRACIGECARFERSTAMPVVSRRAASASSAAESALPAEKAETVAGSPLSTTRRCLRSSMRKPRTPAPRSIDCMPSAPVANCVPVVQRGCRSESGISRAPVSASSPPSLRKSKLLRIQPGLLKSYAYLPDFFDTTRSPRNRPGCAPPALLTFQLRHGV